MKKILIHFLYITLLCTLLIPTISYATNQFDYQDVINKAQNMANKSFEEPRKVPNFLQNINYDKWRDIRFRTEKALWKSKNLPFHVQFFHPGFLYDRGVTINTISAGKAHQLDFSKDFFHYGKNSFQGQIPQDLGFAGFRLHHPINSSEYFDEVAVFLGASYFRAVGKGQRFGLSARGLAIDTAVHSGEEFPYFREFWLKEPLPGSNTMTVYALLDSPSATGGYKFKIIVQETTRMEVNATVFPRSNSRKIGIAPLTSMFLHGENTNIRKMNDFRPEVHDSDGLLIESNSGEWIWRPLINPDKLLVTSFQVSSPKGFGLLQRDKNFDHYQDLETNYEKRPNLWIVPSSDWGKGRVELVQIPTDNEKFDNIVAYWVPENTAHSPSGLSYNYTMDWGKMGIPPEQTGRVVATWMTSRPQKGTRYLIDFQSDKLNAISQASDLHADINVGGGTLKEHQLLKNPAAEGWRLSLLVQKDNGIMEKMTSRRTPLELKAFLRNDKQVITETWSYVDPSDM